MEKAEGIEKLFFDFSSESRLGIIRELTQQNLRMNELGRKLDLTPTEVFRQLQRLAEASVVRKLPDGSYEITNYGKLTLQLLPPLEFTFRHKEYFLTHDVSRIPYTFVNRMGELLKGTLCMDTIETLNRAGQIFNEAENYAWLMGEKSLDSFDPAISGRGTPGVRFRFLFYEHPKSNPLRGPAPRQAPLIEKRTLTTIPGIILCTEKEAGVCLPSTEGRMDYTGFYSKDPVFVAWARDLFLHCWDLGQQC